MFKLIRNIKLILSAIVFIPAVTAAQYTVDYVPIQRTDLSGHIFLIDPIAGKNANVKTADLNNSKESDLFFSKVFFFKNELLRSGQLYFPNEITGYIDSVADRLLAVEPKLRDHIKIYLTRFTQSNAFCFPDGSIFFNIGMLAALENENQLAFIIAHEIGHYAQKHSINDLKKLNSIQQEETGELNKNSALFRSLKFSRESEFEADSWALELLSSAGYDVAQGIKALSRLKNEDSATVSINLKEIFENDLIRLDTAWYSTKRVKAHRERFQKEETDPISSGKLDDLFKTHPDLDKRMEALEVIAKTIKRKNVPTQPIRKTINRLSELAVFECIQNHYNEQNYLNSVVNGLHALKKYPHNVYLHGTIVKSLYWLCYYKEINPTELKAWGDENECNADFYSISCLFEEMGLKEMKKLAYAYTLPLSEAHPGNETLCFYLAISTEQYLGKQAAKNQYREYIQKYPNGQYAALTLIKLQ